MLPKDSSIHAIATIIELLGFVGEVAKNVSQDEAGQVANQTRYRALRVPVGRVARVIDHATTDSDRFSTIDFWGSETPENVAAAVTERVKAMRDILVMFSHSPGTMYYRVYKRNDWPAEQKAMMKEVMDLTISAAGSMLQAEQVAQRLLAMTKAANDDQSP